MKKALGTDGIITFTFDGLEPVKFDAGKCSERVQDYAMQHGFMARIGDNAAISRKQKDGTIITVTEAMRREAVLELVNHYESGTEQWELRTTKAPAQNAAILALANSLGKTYAEAEAIVANGTIADLLKAKAE